MAVWKRTWKTRGGEVREAWCFEYVAADGRRHLRTSKTKKEAVALEGRTKIDVSDGVHVVPDKKLTVASAAQNWLGASRALELERSTLDQYRQHVEFHIDPLIGLVKLSDINVPTVRKFEDRLRKEDRSNAMIGKVMTSLGSILADAQERGQLAKNPVRDLRRNRRRKQQNTEKRKRKLTVGVDIPSPDEIKSILADAQGRWRPLLITAVFTGLRASELRGLRWMDMNLKVSELHVRQRADRYNEIDVPKSEAGHRTVPLPRIVVNTLREWKLACPKSDLGLVFPNGKGNVESLGNIINRGLIPVQLRAGIVTKEGRAKYTGLHSLRHWFASWCINREQDGGLGLPPKNTQELLGHANIAITLDRYGHLFKAEENGGLDKAANTLLG